MNNIISFFEGLLSSGARWMAMGLGILWAWMEPTLPYALLCVFAVVIDCITAWRLNRRIKAKFPDGGADGKLKSSHLFKSISDIGIVFATILLGRGVDNYLLGHFGGLHIDQYIAAIFVLCTFVSILENESSCNGSAWARLVQKIVANKVSRHTDLTEEELNDLVHNNEPEPRPKHRKPRKHKQPHFEDME
jgi:hypothetical protein